MLPTAPPFCSAPEFELLRNHHLGLFPKMKIQREAEATPLKVYICICFLKNISANTFLVQNLPAEKPKDVAVDFHQTILIPKHQKIQGSLAFVFHAVSDLLFPF